METVTIGCRTPLGYTLEVGLQTTARVGNGTMSQLIKTEKYRRFTLRGTREHTRALRKRGFLPPAQRGAEPYLNQNVPKDLWEEWKKTHADNWMLKSENLFEVKDGKDPANAAAAVLDMGQAPRILEPMDPTKKLKVGNDEVEVADFQEENMQNAAARATE